MRIFMIGQKGIPAHGGGIERHVEELATRLAKAGHEVFVYCRAHYTRTREREYRGVHLIHLPTIRTKHLDAIVHTFFATLHVLFQRADIVHYHAVGPALLLWLPRLVKRTAKIFFTFHCQDYHHEKWGFIARLALRLGEASGCRFAHEVIAVSKTLVEYAWTAYQREAVYIPNGAPDVVRASRAVPLRRFRIVPRDYILAVTRLIPHKGIHELIDAYQQCTTTKKLVIVGEGMYTDAYVQTLYRRARGNPNILFVGHREGEVLAALYRNAYCFVHPSHSEGLSIAILEAMRYGCGVLTSNIPENREVVEGAGYTFRTGSVADLTKKLDFLLTHPLVVREAGNRARRRVAMRYQWHDIVATTQALYKNVTTRSSPSPQLFSPDLERV